MFSVFLGFLWLCTQFIMPSQTDTKVHCGAVTDTLKSPRYPNQYPNNMDCMYFVSIPPGMAMSILFMDFFTEAYGRRPACEFDYLKIFNDRNQEFGRYCGERTGQTVLVNGKYAVITFHTDEDFQERGFFLLLTAVPTGNITTTRAQQQPSVCGTVVNNTLKSPGYPNDYPNSTDCIYVVPIPNGMDMKISFQDFELEYEATCSYDYLMITNNNDDNTGKHCGVKTGHTVLVTGNYTLLMFHSDIDWQRRGFLLFFNTTITPQVLGDEALIADLQTSVPPMATFTTSSIGTTKTVFSSTQTVTRAVGITPSQNASNPSHSLSTVVLVVIAVSSVAAGITGIAIPCYLWRKRKNKRKKNNEVSKKNDKWEVKSDYVTIGEELDHGVFGKVHKGIMKAPSLKKKTTSTITVAVKMLQENVTPNQKKDFYDEINLMKVVGSHKNIVSLIGCCTKSSPNFLIVEFASQGDLLSYLKECRKKVKYTKPAAHIEVRESPPPPVPPRVLNQKNANGNYEIGASHMGQVNVAFSKTTSSCELKINSTQPLNEIKSKSTRSRAKEQDKEQDEDEDDSTTPKDMMSFSWQVARGMQYLSGKNIIHRDLAARNVLVCDDKLVKIANFDLARSTLRENVYRTTSQHDRLPVRWMSPEAINDGVFTTKSDVWAYGILLWEIATLGGFPYPGIKDRELMGLLKRGYRMEKPDTCSEEFYQLITRCWKGSPDERPTFTELCQDLEDWMRRDTPYLDLDQLDEDQPYYDASAVPQSSGSS